MRVLGLLAVFLTIALAGPQAQAQQQSPPLFLSPSQPGSSENTPQQQKPGIFLSPQEQNTNILGGAGQYIRQKMNTVQRSLNILERMAQARDLDPDLIGVLGPGPASVEDLQKASLVRKAPTMVSAMEMQAQNREKMADFLKRQAAQNAVLEQREAQELAARGAAMQPLRAVDMPQAQTGQPAAVPVQTRKPQAPQEAVPRVFRNY